MQYLQDKYAPHLATKKKTFSRLNPGSKVPKPFLIMVAKSSSESARSGQNLDSSLQAKIDSLYLGGLFLIVP
jgi:hypothetical protein